MRFPITAIHVCRQSGLQDGKRVRIESADQPNVIACRCPIATSPSIVAMADMRVRTGVDSIHTSGGHAVLPRSGCRTGSGMLPPALCDVRRTQSPATVQSLCREIFALIRDSVRIQFRDATMAAEIVAIAQVRWPLNFLTAPGSSQGTGERGCAGSPAGRVTSAGAVLPDHQTGSHIPRVQVLLSIDFGATTIPAGCPRTGRCQLFRRLGCTNRHSPDARSNSNSRNRHPNGLGGSRQASG